VSPSPRRASGPIIGGARAAAAGLRGPRPWARFGEDASSMIGRWRVAVALLALVAGGLLSALLLLEHYGERRAVAAVSEVCGEGDQSGCGAVSQSRYATVRGVPVAAIGLFFYASLGLLLLLALVAGPAAVDAAAALALLALLAALAVDAVLLGIQAFAIHAFCKLCLLTYVLNAVGVVVLLKARQATGAVGRALGTVDGRIVLTGWAVGSLALLAGVFGSDRALAYRQGGRAASILGSPAPAVPF